MICEKYDVVLAPFPFTDRLATKRRPILVLSNSSFNKNNGATICAMITSVSHSHWQGDFIIEDLVFAGLPSPSKVRLKCFTLDNRVFLKKLGQLCDKDINGVETALKEAGFGAGK